MTDFAFPIGTPVEPVDRPAEAGVVCDIDDGVRGTYYLIRRPDGTLSRTWYDEDELRLA